MSLLTNNNTIHLYNRWISPWYENNSIYSNLIYSDLYVYEFINGIYYQLKIPTSIPIFKEINFNQIILRISLQIFKKKKQKRSMLFYNNKIEFYYFYKKITFLLHKSLFNRKQYFVKNNKNNKYLKKNFYYFINNKKQKNINDFFVKKYFKKKIIQKKKNNLNCFFLKKKRFLLKKKIRYTNKKIKLKKILTTINKKKKYKKKSFIIKKKKKKLLRSYKKNLFLYKNKIKKKSLRNCKNKYINFNFLFWLFMNIYYWYKILLCKLLFIIKILNIKVNNLLKNNIRQLISICYTINNTLISNSYILDIILKTKINIRKKMNWFNKYYYYIILNHLRMKIINTLKIYMYSNIIYFPYYKKKIFNFYDIKLLSDYIKIKLQYGNSIIKIMRKIVKKHNFQRIRLIKKNKKYKKKINKIKKKWFQLIKSNRFNITNPFKYKKIYIRKKRNKKIFFYKKKKINRYLIKWKRKIRIFGYKHYPLIGIRIECNGPTKKGKRTKMITYNEWVNYYKLPGKMPYSTKMTDIHYWQSYARTKKAAIGIKVWLFFRTNLYSKYKKIRKNIKYR